MRKFFIILIKSNNIFDNSEIKEVQMLKMCNTSFYLTSKGLLNPHENAVSTGNNILQCDFEYIQNF